MKKIFLLSVLMVMAMTVNSKNNLGSTDLYHFLNNAATQTSTYKQLKDVDGIYWRIDSEGTLHIQTTSEACPDFKESPFIKYRKSIKNIVFEDSYWSNFMHIGNNMFKGLTNVQSIILPLELKSIGEGAFENCSSLYNMNVSEKVNTIGKDAFKGCQKLLAISLPFNGRSGQVWMNNLKKFDFGLIFGVTQNNIF